MLYMSILFIRRYFFLIYYYERAVLKDNETIKKKVMICITEDTAKNVLCVNDIFNNVEILKFQRQKGIDLHVSALPDFAVPVITLGTSTLVQGCVNITSCWDLLCMQFMKLQTTTLPKELLKKIITLLEEKVGMSRELAITIISAISMQYGWQQNTIAQLQSTIIVDASELDFDFRRESQEMLGSLNEMQVAVFKSITPIDNVTLYQSACTDPLFIELPDRMSLMDDDVAVSTLLPKRSAVCEPYTDNAAYTPMYRTEGKVPKYLYPVIEGSKDNDTSEIYSNEQKYYTAINEWIEYNVKESYGDVDGGVLDNVSQSYLSDLMSLLYIWHWGHNPNVPSGIDEIEINETSDSIDSKYIFTQVPGMSGARVNAVLQLLDFVQEAAMEIGYRVYPDAIIQLARWGDRKGTCIQFESYNYVFKLGSNLKLHKVGSVKDYIPVQENNCDSSLCALINDDTKIGDTTVCKGSWPMPVGIVTGSKLKNKVSGEELEIFTYYSIIDLIREVILNGLKIDGVSFSTDTKQFTLTDIRGALTVSELIKGYETHHEDELQNPFFRSQALKDLYIELKAGSFGVPENQFSLMNTRMVSSDFSAMYRENKFSTYNELKEKFKRREIHNLSAAISVNVVATLLPVYTYVAKRYEAESNLTDIVNLWYDAICMTGYVDEAQFYADRINKGTALPGTVTPTSFNTVTAPKVQNLASFSTVTGNFDSQEVSASETVATPTKKMQTLENPVGSDTKISFIRTVESPEAYAKIVTDRGEVVAYCALNYIQKVLPDGNKGRFTIYTILGKNSLSKIDVSTITETCNYATIIAYIVHSMYAVETGNARIQQLYFDEVQSMKSFRDCISNQVSR